MIDRKKMRNPPKYGQGRSFVKPDPSMFEYSLHIEAIFV